MAEPTAAPPKPPTPKAAAKGLGGVFKNQPKWVWVAGIVVLLGVAYMARRRSLAAAQDEEGDYGVVSNTTGAVGDSSLYPSASQGAFGGYSDPSEVPTVDPIADGMAPTEPSPIIINIPGPQDLSALVPTIAPSETTTAADITGGGTSKARNVAAHQSVQLTPLQKAINIITSIQQGDPAHTATPAQQKAQAVAAASPNINTQDSGSRSGLNYKVVVKNKKVYYFYESRPGKGDWGEGGKIYKRAASNA